MDVMEFFLFNISTGKVNLVAICHISRHYNSYVTKNVTSYKS